MNIAILTLGTRGDVQPYAVLGKALVERGHRVTLSTARPFEQLVRSYGLDFKPVETDLPDMLNSEEGTKIMQGNLFALQRNLTTWIYPLIEQSLHEFYQLALEYDCILYRPKTLVDVFAARFPGKMIRAAVVPALQPTTAFPNPSLSGFPIPQSLHKWSYRIAAASIRMLMKPINNFRKHHGLDTVPLKSETPFLYGISPAFLPRPDDYPENQVFTGFWFDNQSATLDKPLTDFLSSGETPIVLTFGSMHLNPPLDITGLVGKILKKYKTRVIIIKGWGLSDLGPLEEEHRVCIVEQAPHATLFPQVQAVVHHGGVGTTAECLRAGTPMMICPVLYPMGDQKFWGDLAERRGVGVTPLPVSKITEDAFVERVGNLIKNKNLRQRAKRLGARIRRENGIEKAADIVEKTVRA